MKQKTVWIANDGMEFDSQEACAKHEETVTVMRCHDADDIMPFSSSFFPDDHRCLWRKAVNEDGIIALQSKFSGVGGQIGKKDVGKWLCFENDGDGDWDNSDHNAVWRFDDCMKAVDILTRRLTETDPSLHYEIIDPEYGIHVNTPIGELCACVGCDPAYPKIHVYLRRKDGLEIQLAVIDWRDDKNAIDEYVFNDPHNTDPTAKFTVTAEDIERAE